jgi:ubiquinone/menaquinone biosynthesis C-methylase UbiE
MASGDSLFADGAAYERLMGRWSRRAGDRFIDWIGVAEDLRWIDVGCGTGAFTEELIARCAPAAVTAIDPSAEQLAYARGRPGVGAVDFQVGDAQAMTFADASFDVAVMALVIHFVPDPARGVAEMARVLRPGGLAASYVWDYVGRQAPLAPLIAAMKSIGIDSPPPPSAKATSLAALNALWRTAGFETVETRPISIQVEFAGFEDFWDSMTVPVGPAGQAIAAMSAPEKERFRAALRACVPPAPDGRVAFGAVANAVKGRKPA